jgi:predicted DNA binding CopG/RHH family protein
MKKANTKTQIAEPKGLAVVPDEQIDLSDMPEVTDWKGAVRGLFARPETRLISIRLSAADLAAANKLAAAKGMPYQTYIKSLLHEALVKEARR